MGKISAPNLFKLNQFIIRVGRIHQGHRELTSSSMDYRKAGLALIDQGLSDTLCSMNPDLIPWETIKQIEAFFAYLDLHVIDDIEFQNLEIDSVPDRIVNELHDDLLIFLDDFLLAADDHAHCLLELN